MSAIDMRQMMKDMIREEREKRKNQVKQGGEEKHCEQKQQVEIVDRDIGALQLCLDKRFEYNRVPKATVYDEVISECVADELERLVYAQPECLWVALKRRRLLQFGGSPDDLDSSNNKDSELLPRFLSTLCDALVRLGLFSESTPPNHVLANEYRAGQGIFPHRDGPRYVSQVCIVSLGSPLLLDFRESAARDVSPFASLVLRPRSLLCFSETLYTDKFHGIDEVLVDDLSAEHVVNATDQERATPLSARSTRLSLTIRHVIRD
jgi:alkylated DNA repair protein alkB homolog 6